MCGVAVFNHVNKRHLFLLWGMGATKSKSVSFDQLSRGWVNVGQWPEGAHVIKHSCLITVAQEAERVDW